MYSNRLKIKSCVLPYISTCFKRNFLHNFFGTEILTEQTQQLLFSYSTIQIICHTVFSFNFFFFDYLFFLQQFHHFILHHIHHPHWLCLSFAISLQVQGTPSAHPPHLYIFKKCGGVGQLGAINILPYGNRTIKA